MLVSPSLIGRRIVSDREGHPATVIQMRTERLRSPVRWLLVVAVIGILERYAFREGWRLQRDHPEVKLGAGPFVGSWHWRFGVRMLPSIGLGALAVLGLPAIARRFRPVFAVAITSAVATAFALLLAASDGWSAVTAPVADPTEYWVGVEYSRPAGLYLRTFIERQKFYTVHVRGHPPGFMLLLKAVAHVGFARPRAAAVISYVGVAITVAGVSFVVHRVGGSEALRSCLPFLALAPYAVWQGTSADAFYCGVATFGIALLVHSMSARQRWASVSAGLAGGVVLGLGCYLTYAMPTLFPIVVALAWHFRSWRWIAPTFVGAAGVATGFAIGGFWWLDGLNSTRYWYRVGTAQFRPFWYFFFANIAVLVIAVGPAAVAGVVRMRAFRGAVVVTGALAAVVVADVSGLSKAETERIWLLYMPWIGVAAGSLASGASVVRIRLWLVAQAATAVVLQAWLVSKW